MNTLIIEETKPKQWQLTSMDRCDSCDAQAYVKISGIPGDLTFCGHHYNKIMMDPESYTKMMSFMITVLDERERLIENKTIGSEN